MEFVPYREVSHAASTPAADTCQGFAGRCRVPTVRSSATNVVRHGAETHAFQALDNVMRPPLDTGTIRSDRSETTGGCRLRRLALRVLGISRRWLNL